LGGVPRAVTWLKAGMRGALFLTSDNGAHLYADNTFDAFRNQLAFGLFGIAALLLLMGRSVLNRNQIAGVLAIAVLIPILEFAQIWMPTRHVDIDDVLNGWLGLGLACVLYLVARGLWKIITRESSKTGLATRRGEH
jgi:glycopeptide antibiotics resistance protein